MSMELFADLMRQQAIRYRPVPVQSKEFLKLLIEAANDYQLMVDPRRAIEFYVDRRSLVGLGGGRLRADPPLLEQAVNCLLDNAGKYSYQNTMRYTRKLWTGGMKKAAYPSG